MELQKSTYVSVKMSHRSPRNQIEGSDYKDKCGQQAGDVGEMSNHEKRKIQWLKKLSACLPVLH